MIIVKEKENLDEMALQVVSSRKDGLPFRIVIKSPDHQPPHAHIMDLKTGKTELGQFEISKNPPRSAEDIKGYKQGITDDMRQAILNWSKAQNRNLPKFTNWDMLCAIWCGNEKW